MDKFKVMTSQGRAEFWKNEITEYHASGKRFQEVRAERDIGVSSLLSWRRKLELAQVDPKNTVSISVHPPKAQRNKGSVLEDLESKSKVQLEVSGISICLTTSMDPGWVAVLVMALNGVPGSC